MPTAIKTHKQTKNTRDKKWTHTSKFKQTAIMWMCEIEQLLICVRVCGFGFKHPSNWEPLWINIFIHFKLNTFGVFHLFFCLQCVCVCVCCLNVERVSGNYVLFLSTILRSLSLPFACSRFLPSFRWKMKYDKYHVEMKWKEKQTEDEVDKRKKHTHFKYQVQQLECVCVCVFISFQDEFLFLVSL